ncbi:hypothetical protein BC835DRAFT_1406417 [Cytidiella melzeri]|nr:hypothetical protein BC835DRAFT_1406417 [Cytidiella melzeri]
MSTSNTTRHLNRLANSKSPYLLQHAENPVDWFEWGPEAFEKAKQEDKPIFLSVGYSACHWCHVLAHESFEDETTARMMNQRFINIKVDREERPDVDRLYMTFLQATSGGGGWPLSVWLTPDLHPFFAGTYFPKGRFRGVLSKLSELWEEDRERVRENGKQVINSLQVSSKIAPSESPVSIAEATSTICKHLTRRFDTEHGGFGGAPKFPSPAQTIHFLARYASLHQSSTDTRERELVNKAKDMSVHTMVKIYNGGIRDVVGGGFSRYSVDDHWHVPHCEYDEAQLLSSALELAILLPFTSSHRKTLEAMAIDIIDYVSRDLRSSEGGFYSAEDADSFPSHDSTVKKEGAFYAWTAEQLDEILGEGTAAIFGYHFGVKLGGNCDPKHDIEGHLTGQNILYTAQSVKDTAEHFDASPDKIQPLLEECLAKLKEYRDKYRPRPHLDDKILTCWNGLMISGLAKAAEILEGYQDRTLSLAEASASFLRKHLYDQTTGELRRSYREGPGPIGQADDYAFLIQGLLDLYEASGKEEYVSWAIRLQEKQDELFYDENGGGYFASAPDPHILVRMKDAQDGAEPSAASVTIYNLQRLAHFAEDRHVEYREKAESILRSNSQLLDQAPFALATMVSGAMLSENGYRQFLSAIRRAPMHNRVLIHLDPRNLPQELPKLNGTIRSLVAAVEKDERPNVRVCENFACGLPVYDVEGLRLPIAVE